MTQPNWTASKKRVDSMKKLVILLAALVVIALPFIVERPQEAGDWEDGDPELVIITPHNEAIRHECARGFSAWHQKQFAFDPNSDSTSLPHNISENTVVYTGTHDNPTLVEWQENLSNDELEFVTDYLCCYNNLEVVDRMIRKALESPAKLCIIPISDWMHLGSDCRMNTPSTNVDNWAFKLKDIPCDDLCDYIKKLTKIYRRNY